MKHVLIDVPCDADFAVNHLARFEKFYFNHMPSRLADDFVESRGILGNEYKALTAQFRLLLMQSLNYLWIGYMYE